MEQEDRSDTRKRETLERELEWIRMSPRAKQAKGKARLNDYEQLRAQADQGSGRLEKLEIAIPPGDRLGDQVIDFDHVTKGFEDRLLIDDLSFKLPPAGIVGVIGPNGAGKTTLFKMITGAEEPDDGTITVGKTVQPVLRRPETATSSTTTRPSTRRSPAASTSC